MIYLQDDVLIGLLLSHIFSILSLYSLHPMLLFPTDILLKGICKCSQSVVDVHKKLTDTVNEDAQILPELMFGLSDDRWIGRVHEATSCDGVG